jgi:hypothetical protein
MLEITGDDIALLNEQDLRTLIGRLCEAELSRRALPLSAVTWGGDQNATDGGLDVRVQLPSRAVIDGFIPRANTGFQVKRTDMPRSNILQEMRPDNHTRPTIGELAASSGAYIMVSSLGSTSDSALRNRRRAMKDAIADLATRESLFLDFYDRGRVATWVREHAGLVVWVRERIAKPLTAWHAYDAWAFSPHGLSDEYLLDKTVRIQTGRRERDNGITADEGILRIRDLLRHPRGVVRLIGLSGVGKTRFVQALFDNRLGKDSLDPSLALYTDLSYSPNPQPIALASELFQLSKRAILVIDNCPADLHKRLSEVCRSPDSFLSVITIEYDIRDDQPEGTDVFELQPSSGEVIEKLLTRRFPSLSPVDARTITRFSEGNARVAINLASTVGVNESIAGLTDSDLFVRLFQQRQGHSESFLTAAQACSLVYSFNGEDLSSSEDGELVRLGRLVGRSAEEMFRAVAELKRRDLVQQRGPWQAVLPHAIANRLAALALQDISTSVIDAEIFGGPDRLLLSFSRRLGFLHKSMEAATIVESWLKEGGFLGKVDQLSDFGRAMFRNVAPVLPELTLVALERSFGPEHTSVDNLRLHLPLLHSLAYDAALFERCVALIARVVGKQNSGVGGFKGFDDETFASLFKIYLSGTLASPEQRASVVEQFLCAPEKKERVLGKTALNAMLQTQAFSSMHEFEFGARPRDYGYQPRTREDLQRWFGATLTTVRRLISHAEARSPVLAILARNFRGLWTQAHMYDELEQVCKEIANIVFWPEGWVAVRETQLHDSVALEKGTLAKLDAIELSLRPKDISQRVRSIVFAEHSYFDPDPGDGNPLDFASAYEKIEETARKLGEVVSSDKSLDDLAAELVRSKGHLWAFGVGLATGASNPLEVWHRLTKQLSDTPVAERRIEVFCGFLYGLSQKSRQLTDDILDAAVNDDSLSAYYPIFPAAVGVDARGVDRLLHSLRAGKAPIYAYRSLGGGRATEHITGEEMRRVVGEIAGKAEGFDVAVEVLGMRIYSEGQKKTPPDQELLRAGRELMQQIPLDSQDAREDYHAGEIVKFCFAGPEGRAAAHDIASRLRELVLKRRAFLFAHDDLLHALLGIQPAATLDGLFLAEPTAKMASGLEYSFWDRRNPFDGVPEDELLNWCDVDPTTRFPLIASVVGIYASAQGAERAWSNIALRLLERAPDRIEVLKRFMRQFEPSGWTGSRASAIEVNAKLLDQLTFLDDMTLQQFIAAEKIRITRFVEDEKRRELQQDRAANERFE